MTQQVHTPFIEFRSAGTKPYPAFSVESDKSHVGAKVFSSDDVEGIRIKARNLFPVIKTMQSYGVNRVAYIGGYVAGSKDGFMSVLLMLIAELKKLYGDDLSILLHIDVDEIDMLHNALVFADFDVDGSLNNGAASLAAYTLNI